MAEPKFLLTAMFDVRLKESERFWKSRYKQFQTSLHGLSKARYFPYHMYVFGSGWGILVFTNH